MRQPELEPLAPELSALLASEREILPEPAEIRERALLRARAVLRATALEPRSKAPLGTLRWLLAAALVLVAANLLGAALRAKRRLLAPAVGAAPTFALQSNPPRKPNQASVATQSELEGAPDRAPVAAELGVQPTLQAAAPQRATPVIAPRPISSVEAYALELALLGPARAALAHGDFASALAAIGKHERRFPSGQLAEEREALRVQALSGLGRANDARQTAAAFRARFPGSILLSRMKEPAPSAP
jgi:hypothetical protein